ncbi:winged helix-turn-helix domain-containing protein [Thalassotalea marina]|uniref:OmpR/PhoB-type domain-containing protein n=1 Tax=Thalassotalea marina TaxID=1673741 RepID=A0A919BK27_9GAMM|nr:winged helix-turn-helix domain-containing protein [Thalassotalea marina]GHF96992.1 hypothetical protein GCM10017161_26350 [Thalassotalea marina]
MFATRFYVNNTLVDLLHSTVTIDDNTQSIEPKILKVLALLAKHQNEVVTHDVIKNAIWPNVEVVPNALQRCIAQLRKVLGDDAKRQEVIVTHPKIGYRLTARVEIIETNNKTLEQTATSPQRFSFKSGLILFLLVLVASVFFWHHQSSSPMVKYNYIQELTQSEENDLFPTFSPDGQYLIFTRMIGTCQSQIWAKHLESGKESQLTQVDAVYTLPSFSPDGSQIFTTVQESCTPQASTNNCWSIQSVDFAQALTAPAKLNTVHRCDQHLIELAHGLGNNKVAFLKMIQNRYQLMQVDNRTQVEQPIYQNSEKRIYYYDHHAATNTFAVIARDSDHNDWLILLDEQGQLISEVLIERPVQSGAYDYVEANFAANGEYLIYANNSGTFNLYLSGKTEEITIAEKGIIMVTAAPDMQSLVGVRGHVDTDVALINLADEATWQSVQGSFNQEFQPYKSLSRSTAVERKAKFQPNGDLIAYISDKNGSEQVWLTDLQHAYPLTRFRQGSNLNDIHWSPDGTHLLLSANDQLVQVDLQGNSQIHAVSVPVRFVLDWYSDNEVLISANHHKVRELYVVNLTNGELTSLGIDNVASAAIRDDTLYVLDRDDRLMQIAMAELQQTSPEVLAEQVDVAVFAIDGVYWTNHKTRHLMSKSYNQSSINTLMTLKDKTTFITDVKADNLLTTQIISARKELVKLF